MRNVIALFIVSLFIVSGCVNKHIKRGDAAAATGDWKIATVEYRNALQKDPDNAELKRKFENAKRQAIEQALAIGRRCRETGDPLCVEKEMTFVLEFNPTNAEAAKMLQSVQKDVALLLIEKARQAAKDGKFLAAAKMLAEARDKSKDEDLVSKADDVAKEMANLAVEYVDALLKQTPPEDPESQLKRFEECFEIMSAVINYVPDRYDLLVASRNRRDAAKKALEKIREERRAAERARRRKIAANRSRTVAFVGVLVNISKTDGSQWDGLGEKASAQVASAIATALTGANPVTAITGILSRPAAASMAKPDVTGVVEMFSGKRSLGGYNLYTRKDTFTPQWSNIVWNNVDINNAYLKVTLFDKDLSEDDSIGIFEISSRALQAAADAGEVFPVRVDKQTNGQVLFALISVK